MNYYNKLPSFVLGFHGCDESVQKKVLIGEEKLKPSKNDYDWLGHGIYFWENDPNRALKWAKDSNKIEKPAVLGAVIDLGECLNLFEQENLQLVHNVYKNLKKRKFELPRNHGKDLYKRDLDCFVINSLHNMGKYKFDTVRSPFWEGYGLYKNSGFRTKNHIQICVINPKCIKGYFCPMC